MTPFMVIHGGDAPPHKPVAGRTMRGAAALVGLRVLLVEDETMVAMMIEEMLDELGCERVGTAARVSDALNLIATEDLDIAVLDINLGGEKVFPVADRLAAEGVPFLFSTGYGPAGLSGPYGGRLVLQKPYELSALADGLVTSLG